MFDGMQTIINKVIDIDTFIFNKYSDIFNDINDEKNYYIFYNCDLNIGSHFENINANFYFTRDNINYSQYEIKVNLTTNRNESDNYNYIIECYTNDKLNQRVKVYDDKNIENLKLYLMYTIEYIIKQYDKN